MGIESPFLFLGLGLAVLIMCLVFAVRSARGIRAFAATYGNIGAFVKSFLFRFTLVALTGLFIAAAFSNVYYIGGKKAEASACIDAIILNDDSFSMTAKSDRDGPSRLERSQKIAYKLAEGLSCANIEVCEFTNRLLCRARFGSSHNAIANTIKGFGPDAITGSGSDIEGSLSRLVGEFPEDSKRPRFVFVLSDGGNALSSEYYLREFNLALEHLADSKISIIAIGVGEDYEVPVALVPRTNLYSKEETVEIDGQRYEVIRSKLEEAKLIHMAAKTAGLYIHEDEFSIDKINSFALSSLEEQGIIRPVTTSLAPVFGGAALVCLFLFGLFFMPSFRKK
jgi:hypothetical protein